jgi:hypothetical protein
MENFSVHVDDMFDWEDDEPTEVWSRTLPGFVPAPPSEKPTVRAMKPIRLQAKEGAS